MRAFGFILSMIAAVLAFVCAIVTCNPAAAFEGLLIGTTGAINGCEDDS